MPVLTKGGIALDNSFTILIAFKEIFKKEGFLYVFI